jgi:hypothetical protein
MGEEQPPSSVCGTANTTGASWVRVESDGEEDAEQRASRASEAQSVSSICTSRPSSKRSAAHRAKKAAVSMAKAQKKREASGGVWDPTLPRAEYVALQREKMSSMLQELAKLQLTEAEKREQIKMMFAPPPPTATPPPPPNSPSPTSSTQYIIDGVCQLCGKVVDDMHLHSATHLQRVGLNQQLDELLGASEVVRGLYAGMTSELTVKDFCAFWGAQTPFLHKAAMAIVGRKGFQLRFGGSKSKMYQCSAADIKELRTGAVSYEITNAKYTGMVYRPWDLIPAGRPGVQAPFGTGWWPVVEVQMSEADFNRRGHALLICIYQLLDARPDAWWIEVDSQPPAAVRPSPPPPPALEGVWEEGEPPPEPPARVPALRSGTAPPPPPPTWGDTRRPGAIAQAAEEVD